MIFKTTENRKSPEMHGVIMLVLRKAPHPPPNTSRRDETGRFLFASWRASRFVASADGHVRGLKN